MEALERGDWRTALELAPRLGRPGIAVRLLALSMRSVRSGWSPRAGRALADAADCPAKRRSSPHASVHVSLAWPYRAGNEFWCRFGLVGQREEFQARSQWFRIEDSDYPKRTCLVESCVDHLTWVFFDRSTWRPVLVDEWLAVSDRVTRGKFGESGREYFLRRANELFHFVYPLSGSLTRKVWDDVGGYCGLHDAALTALAGRDDMHTGQVGSVQPIRVRLPGRNRPGNGADLLVKL